jgi:hypothetical protein
MLLGVKDCFTHWFLILRCSWIGGALGAIPGIGVSVIDWIAYGHALKTEKGAPRPSARATCAASSRRKARPTRGRRRAVPTVAFGVPSSATMAILLGAFLIHGLVPGPDMLTKNLDITYSMVWSIALANILGAGLCFAFSGQLAKLATLRYTLIMPCVLSLIYIGAFEATRQWGDLYSLLFFGLLGWAMKQFRWPRPPLVLGFVLGDIIERYMFISIERYRRKLDARPIVMAMFALALLTILRPLLQDIREHHGIGAMLSNLRRAALHADNLFPAALLSLIAVMFAIALQWDFAAKIIPVIVGCGAILTGGLSLANDIFSKRGRAMAGGAPALAVVSKQQDPHGRRIEDRTPAGGQHPAARLHVLRLAGRVPVLDGGDRPAPDRPGLRRRLYAAGGTGEMAARHSSWPPS